MRMPEFIAILFRQTRHEPMATELEAARRRLDHATDDFFETIRATLDRHDQPPERAPSRNVSKH